MHPLLPMIALVVCPIENIFGPVFITNSFGGFGARNESLTSGRKFILLSFFFAIWTIK
jgi:hypothetical protein